MIPDATHRFLTGITTTGTPHLGNYVGALRPAIQMSRRPDVENFYFLADYHALIKCDDPSRIQRSTLEIAACWLAAGLDPERTFFYRQSDVPEIPELAWFLACVCGKGLLNRAHAYKASTERNAAQGAETDAGVTAGLFMYPVLMAADIILFNARRIPVGRDQVQHVEMARDIAASFNHLYGEHFALPEAAVDAAVATLPGLDGRKMSKSYNNTIPLFAPREELRRLIFSLVTDSTPPGQPKEVEGSALFQLYQAFATEGETAALRQAYAAGIGWGEAKQMLFDRIDAEVGPIRERYEALVADPSGLEGILQEGARKVRARAAPFLAQLRHAVGLRNLADRPPVAVRTSPGSAKPLFKQYREDTKHYFKLFSAGGTLLLQSVGFASPQQAGRAVAALRAQGLRAGVGAVHLPEGVSENDVGAALALLGD